MKNKPTPNKHYSVIDLFCGVGGMTHGFSLEGFNVIAGLDSDPACRYPYEFNNNAMFIEKKIEDVDPNYLLSLYPPNTPKLLIGCAPCQPYSRYNQKQKNVDGKWQLLSNFSDTIEVIEPEIVSMENVPELRTFDDGKVFNRFVDRLKEQEYKVDFQVVYCPDYGIPQRRTRLVLLASKLGEIKLIDKTHSEKEYLSVKDAIGDLSPIKAGESSATDALHRSSKLSELNLRRIQQSKPGGTWRDWDEELIADCHKKTTGTTYSSVYGRMTWDEPAPTITTQCHGYGNGRFGHPEQNRAISLREAALLQSFPRTYQFVDPKSAWHIGTIGRLIGNAVPVQLGRVIARSISQHLEMYS